MVYGILSTNAAQDLAFKILPSNATNFSGITEQYIDDAGHSTDIQYSLVSLDRDPVATSEELILVGFDSTSSDVNAWVWNGNSWGNRIELSAAATATGGGEAIAVKYNTPGTHGMVIGAHSTTTQVNTTYWSGSAWVNTGLTDLDTSDALDVKWITLQADPATDDLLATFLDSGSDLHTAYWSGATWTFRSNHDTTVDSNTARPVDVVWNSTGGNGILVVDTDGTGTTINQTPCNPQCTGTSGTISTYAGTGTWLTLYRNPTASEGVKAIGIRMNDSGALDLFTWDGSTIQSSGVLTTDTGNTLGEAYAIDFQLSTAQFSNLGSIDFSRILDCQKCGQHKAPPLTDVNITISADFTGTTNGDILIDYFEKDWTVVDANGGKVESYDTAYNKISWTLTADVNTVSRNYVIRSPALTIPPTDYNFQTELIGVKSSLWQVKVADPAEQQFFETCSGGDIGDWNIVGAGAVWAEGSGGDAGFCWTTQTGSETNMTSPKIDLSAANISYVNLSFLRSNSALDTDGDYFRVWVNSSVNAWVLLLSTNDNSAVTEEFNLFAYISLNTGVHIRAGCKSDDKNDECRWDNINITAYSIIANSAPNNPSSVIINSSISAQTNFTDENLAANFICDDPDASDTLTYDIYFYKNSVANLSFKNQVCSDPQYVSVTFNHGNTTRGDLWSFSVNVTDDSATSSSTVFSNNMTIRNRSPVVGPILPSPIPAQTITLQGLSNLTISFLTDDIDGTSDINDSTALANITIENVVRVNSTCFAQADINSTRANYTCTLGMWYFDTPGNITLNVTIADINGARSVNGTNYTLQSTLAMVVGPASVAFPSIAPASVNTTANNDPIYVNNTGNQNVTLGNVRVQAFDLIGQDNNAYIIPGGNFSVGTATGSSVECSATNTTNGTAVGITSSILGRGNNTGGFAAANGIEELYICLRDAPAAAVLPSQVYSATGASSWVISVV